LGVAEAAQGRATSPWTAAAALLERALDFDFTRPWAFLALGAVYVVSRIPWLNLGYGTDPDAWRVALSAHHLLDAAEYLPSRLPGYPLHEFVTAAFVRGGWVWTNLSTVLVSLLGVYLFARLASELRLPARGALTIAFAFAPLLWINSVTTMDYMWALTAILGSYLLTTKGRPGLAGACLGLAVGFRVTSGGMALPLALLLWRQGRTRDLPRFVAALLAVSLLAYSPVIAVYGLRFLNFYDASVTWQSFLNRLGKDALGVLGALAVLVGLAFSWRNLRRLPNDLRGDAHVLVWVTVVVLYFVSFARLPHEIAYLTPVFPFGLFLMARYFRPFALRAALAIILLAGFVDITSPGDTVNMDTFTQARLGGGMLLSDLDTLRSQMDFADEVRDAGVPPNSVVMTGFIFPELTVLHRDDLHFDILDRDYGAISMLSDRGEAVDEARDVRYVWLLKYDDFLALREQGYHFYYVVDARGSTASLFDYRPPYFGAEKLDLARESPSAGKGAAKTER
jgi:hypothetical protein